MTYFPETVPQPDPGPDDGGFWSAARDHRLVVQRCADCGTLRHPPLPVCANCYSFDYEWQQSSGEGTVFSYTIIRRAAHPSLQERVPYSVVIVELEDIGNIRMIGNLVDWAENGISIGQRVQLAWDDYADMSVPRFQSLTQPADHA